MNKKYLTVFFLMIALHFSLFSIYRTPEAGRYYFWLFSPELLGRSMGWAGIQDPSGIAINPASNAFIQNVKIEASYGVAPGLWYSSLKESFASAGDFFLPFLVNSGFVIPTRFGNFTGYVNHMNMSNNSFNEYYNYQFISNNNDLRMGKVSTVYFSYSKDYSDQFALGLSSNIKIGFNPLKGEDRYNFDVGGGLDVGIIIRPQWNLFLSERFPAWGLQDFELAIVLKELGKPLINFPSLNHLEGWFPLPFTAAFGFSFNIYNNGTTYWKWLIDMSTPFFQNFVLAAGTEIQIYNFLVIRGSYTFDLEGFLELVGAIEQYETLYNIANLGFGASFKFSFPFKNKGKSKKEIQKDLYKTTEFSIDLAARPYHNGFVFQTGCTIQIGARDTNPPRITYVQKDLYASPNLDGIQDDIRIDLTITDERYIKMWKMEIYDSQGRIIRLITNKEDRIESRKVRAAIKKFFAPKTGIPIPDQIIWDGRDDQGNFVADGRYTYRFFAMDDNENMDPEGTEKGEIIIDTEKPMIDSQITHPVFSPNDDGSKDELIIDIEIIQEKRQSISAQNPLPGEINLKKIEYPPLPVLLPPIKNEVKAIKTSPQLWYVDILNARGELIKRYTYHEKGRFQIKWDGKDQTGAPAGDGVYQVKLHSKDPAGNYWEKLLPNIIINTEPTPVEVHLATNIFSPNNDGVKDQIKFFFEIPNQNGVEKWEYSIEKGNKVIKTFQGQGLPPQELIWDGRDQNNQLAAESSYQGQLKVNYINGNKPRIKTPVFEIDVTAPTANLRLSNALFSPDGDGKKDAVIINHKTSLEEEWHAVITDEQGNKLKTYNWKKNPPSRQAWQGRDNNGRLVPDGKYYYQLLCKDRAGNYFETEKQMITLFTAATPVFITAAYDSFSPNNDQIKDEQLLEINARISPENEVRQWELAIKNKAGRIVYTVQQKNSLQKLLYWNGSDLDDKPLPDGEYSAWLTVQFEAGNTSQSQTKNFNIDTAAPRIAITVPYPSFSPNNDGRKDDYQIIQEGSSEEQWQAFIYDQKNNILWQDFYAGFPARQVIWKGLDQNNNLQKNGYYRYVIKSTDQAGNTGQAVIDDIELKNLHTPLFLTLSEHQFSPNQDGIKDQIKINSVLSVTEDIDRFQWSILDQEKKAVKKISGPDQVPAELIWNGIDDEGRQAGDGFYTAHLEVSYTFGNKNTVESVPFILDTTAPRIDLKISPQYFSPDNDNVDDELWLDLDAYDLSGIKEWKLVIMNPDQSQEFVSYQGVNQPTPRITWNGKSKQGHLVESAEDYPVKIYAVDQVGNSSEKKAGPIMVDILIIQLKDGRLKIKISNIEFKADSAEMTDSPKNKKIIQMLAKALRKYLFYNITLEGHANRYKEGLNEIIARDLSKRRTQTVAEKLIARGINAKRMTSLSRGFDRPLVPLTPDASQEDLARNRRVEFYLEKK